MRKVKTILTKALLFGFLMTGSPLAAQLYQTIRGTVIDVDSKAPITGAAIVIQDVEPAMAAISDNDGKFVLSKVPVGRHELKVSFLGYDPKIIPNLLLSSGKEMFLDIEIKESTIKIEDVVVKATRNRGDAMNAMAPVSARSFNADETRFYAGGLDDPSRLASAFAGVSTDGNVENNAIMVRGNSPSGVLWQIDGIETPVPSHFSNAEVLGGGGITMFSNQMLSNSDFYTGAFPAEFGNVSSGVFNIRLRNGNNEKREHAIQVGLLGLDVSSEGPINRETKSSYLFNYRYSTMGLVSNFLPDGGLPKYQDLCFKFNIPTKKLGTFTFWGIGGISNFFVKPEDDTSKYKSLEDRQKVNADFVQGTTAITHKIFLGTNTYLQSAISSSSNNQTTKEEYLNDNLEYYIDVKPKFHDTRFAFKSLINHKFNARHTNKTGVILTRYNYNYSLSEGGENLPLTEFAQSKGNTMTTQVFSQSKFDISNHVSFNAGVHFFYLQLNKKYAVEPRASLKWNAAPRHSFSIAYGMHSQMQFMSLYFVKRDGAYANKDLDFMRAQHFVLGYNFSINENLRLKVEPYYQILTKIPLVPGTNIAVINVASLHSFNETLQSNGKGRNYGVDITLEKFLSDGFYCLSTASLFQSKYTGNDGIERNTMYNNNYVVNLLGGKEWKINNTNLFGVSCRVYLKGGNHITPANAEESVREKELVLDETRCMEDQEESYYRLDLSVNYKINRAGKSYTLSAQVNNLLFSPTVYKRYFNYRTNSVVSESFGSPFPNLSWKMEF